MTDGDDQYQELLDIAGRLSTVAQQLEAWASRQEEPRSRQARQVLALLDVCEGVLEMTLRGDVLPSFVSGDAP